MSFLLHFLSNLVLSVLSFVVSFFLSCLFLSCLCMYLSCSLSFFCCLVCSCHVFLVLSFFCCLVCSCHVFLVLSLLVLPCHVLSCMYLSCSLSFMPCLRLYCLYGLVSFSSSHSHLISPWFLSCPIAPLLYFLLFWRSIEVITHLSNSNILQVTVATNWRRRKQSYHH